MKTTKSFVTILISILMFSPMVAIASQTITDDFNNTSKISTYSNLYINTTAGHVKLEYNYSTYMSSGTLYSTNLLSGLNVTDVYEFSYDAAIIGDETISISFTQNNVTFYSSTALGASQLLQNGAHTINLRTLGWKGGFFYYNVTFTEGSSGTTPELNEISLSYSTSTTEGKILGTVLVVGIISLPIIVGIMLVKKRK